MPYEPPGKGGQKQAVKREKRAFQKAIQMELREHKSSFLVFSVLRVLVIVSLVRQIMLGSYESAFYCALALALLYVPSWVQVQLRIELPPALEISVLCFIFAAEILGRSTPSTSASPAGTPCSTPSTASWPRR